MGKALKCGGGGSPDIYTGELSVAGDGTGIDPSNNVIKLPISPSVVMIHISAATSSSHYNAAAFVIQGQQKYLYYNDNTQYVTIRLNGNTITFSTSVYHTPLTWVAF